MSAAVSILMAGFVLGMIHALDIDHIMTISSLSARPKAATLRFAARWALGHGGVLVLVAAAALLLQWQLPEAVPASAERMVGVVLILAGLSVVGFPFRNRHAAPGQATLREKAPFAIGVIHGLAGSATLLALVPLALYRPMEGIGYAAVFSLGVLCAMMGFAFLLDRAQRRLLAGMPQVHAASRVALATGAIGLGLYWVQAA